MVCASLYLSPLDGAMRLAARLRLTSCTIFIVWADSGFPAIANDHGVIGGLAFSGLAFTKGGRRWVGETLGLHIHFDPMLMGVGHIELGLEFVKGEEQKFADEGQVGGIAGWDAVLGDGFEEFAEDEIDVRGGHEPAGKRGGKFGAEAIRFDDLPLGTSVENTEGGMILLAEHAARAAVGERELAERGFVGGDAGARKLRLSHDNPLKR